MVSVGGWILNVYDLCLYIATTVLVGAGCKLTDPAKTQCINSLTLAQAVLNIASDFFVIVLPLPMCYALHIPRGQRLPWHLSWLLAHRKNSDFWRLDFSGTDLRFSVFVASLIRLIIIQGLPGETDTTWVKAATSVWS
jgi:hypothetical protein